MTDSDIGAAGSVIPLPMISHSTRRGFLLASSWASMGWLAGVWTGGNGSSGLETRVLPGLFAVVVEVALVVVEGVVWEGGGGWWVVGEGVGVGVCGGGVYVRRGSKSEGVLW